jgi:hypothetical protein
MHLYNEIGVVFHLRELHELMIFFRLMKSKNLFNLGTHFSLVEAELIANINNECGSDSNYVISLLISLFFYPRILFKN